MVDPLSSNVNVSKQFVFVGRMGTIHPYKHRCDDYNRFILTITPPITATPAQVVDLRFSVRPLIWNSQGFR